MDIELDQKAELQERYNEQSAELEQLRHANVCFYCVVVLLFFKNTFLFLVTYRTALCNTNYLSIFFQADRRVDF